LALMARPKGMQSALLGSLAFLALAVWPRASHALELELTWNAPTGCPSGAEVQSEFEHLTKVPPGGTPMHLTAEARIEQSGARWLLHLATVRDGLAGEREIEAGSCASLAHAAALVLALAFGEMAAQAEEARAPAPPLPAAPPPPVITAPPAPPQPALALAVGAFGLSAWGPLPGRGLGFGAGVDAGAAGRRWFGSLRVLGWSGVDQTALASVITRYDGAGASLSACLAGVRARYLSLAACAGFQAGALRGTPSGVLLPTSKVAPWYAAVPGLRARVPVYRALHLDLSFELAASLNRPRFSVTEIGAPDRLVDVYVVPRLGPSAQAGLSFDL
jgi:hypothetical protein